MMMQHIKPVFAGQDLLEAWHQLRSEQPGLRIRDGAVRLNVSEAELVYASLGQGVVRLRPAWRELMEGLPAVGPVMALTRNEHCVHERHGVYDNATIGAGGQIGLVVNEAIDLRLFLRHWASLFAVSEPIGNGGIRHSLQIFDHQGQAVHKIYLTPASDENAWAVLCGRLREDSGEALTILDKLDAEADLADEQVDRQALVADWAALKDTHHFLALLKRHRVSRLQALRLAGPTWAERLAPECLAGTLERSAEAQLAIMVFVGNHGCIQIHSGPVSRLRRIGEWFNVLDPDFNLHLRDSAIEQLWRVRKPTADGIVSSLEAYDANGELIIQLFGLRKPGQPEQPDWRELVESHAAL